jgi:hypothetical protein
VTLRPHYTEPCWEIVRVDTKHPAEYETGDGWAHYRTEAVALEYLAERQEETDTPLTVARSFSTPCVGLFCDGPNCGAADDPCDFNGEGWTHLDPADPLPFGMPDDWTEIDGKHYCDDCTPPWCEAPRIPGQLTLEEAAQ